MTTDFMGRDCFTWFTGVVEDRADPLQVGRVRVRCLGYHTENKEELPTADLPWASVMHSVTDPSMSGLGHTPSFLVEGSWVVGFFRDTDLQEPIVMGSLPGIPSSFANGKQGFNDPNEVYPKEINQSDVNKLARGTQLHTYTADTEISEPADPYNAEYPKNHVYATESGHLKEYDDTVGAERIRERHKSGTFYEIHPDGKRVTHIVYNDYKVVAADDYVHVKGNVNLVIDADCNTTIKGNWDVNVTGDITIDGNTINLNNGTKGAARIDDTSTDNDTELNGPDTGIIKTGSGTVFIGD